MPKYVIERNVKGIGRLGDESYRNMAAKSNAVLKDLGPDIQWLESFVTGDKLYCVYIAPNAEMIEEHARRGGFPADNISEVKRMLDPSTGEGGDPAA
jgi:hypothetical protein